MNMSDTRQRIIRELAYHTGGWLDNGNPDMVRCACGHRGKLGEFHGAHVADAIMVELGLT